MISLPDTVPLWVVAALAPIMFSAGVLFWAIVSGDRYETGRTDGIQEAVDDLMDMTARSRP